MPLGSRLPRQLTVNLLTTVSVVWGDGRVVDNLYVAVLRRLLTIGPTLLCPETAIGQTILGRGCILLRRHLYPPV